MADGTARIPRRDAWIHRAALPGSVSAGLGLGSELWLGTTELPGYSALMATARRLGTPVDPVYELTVDLLIDVLAGAGAVEFTVEKITRNIGLVEQAVAELVSQPSGAEPEFGSWFGHRSIDDIYTEFAGLLIWLRSLEDRLERADLTGRKDDKAGLIPSLLPKSPLALEVGALFEVFSTWMKPVRRLANYSIHHRRVPQAFGAGARIINGQLAFPIPDSPTAPLQNALDLKYGENRTVAAFASEALQVVDILVDGILNAFEQHAPSRLRR